MFKLFSDGKLKPDHEERLTAVERQLRALQVEWMDTLDRLKTMMGRVVKDRARAEAARGEDTRLLEPTESVESQSPNGLTHRQMELNTAILARRNRRAM